MYRVPLNVEPKAKGISADLFQLYGFRISGVLTLCSLYKGRSHFHEILAQATSSHMSPPGGRPSQSAVGVSQSRQRGWQTPFQSRPPSRLP